MTRVQQDFQERVDEIEAYFEFVQTVDAGETILSKADGSGLAYEGVPRENLLRTCRAGAFLLLYNLMESTVTNAVEAIFDELELRGVSFDDCSANVRSVVLGNLRAMSPANVLPLLTHIATDVVARTFNRDEIVSGNVDARKIRDLAKAYGFDHPEVFQVRQLAVNRGFPVTLPSGERLAGDGAKLLEVKARRNALAHGSVSFAEVGRDFSCDTLAGIKWEVISYLDTLLQNVADYLASQKYKSSPAPATTQFPP